MTTATAPRIGLPFADHTGSRARSRSGGDGLTLGQTLANVWEGLSAAGATECPVCHGCMVAVGNGSGGCRDCGTRIA